MSKLSIDLICPPFHGHLHPLLGIAAGLRAHADLRLISTEAARGSAERMGIDFAPILEDGEKQVFEIANAGRSVRSDPWLLWKQFRENIALLPKLHQDLETLWERKAPRLALVDFTLPTVGHLARQRGIHWWTSHASPLAIETREGPPSYLGGLAPGQGPLGRLRDRAGRLGIRCFKRAVFALNRGCFEKLGVRSVYRPDGTENCYSDEVILALGTAELEFSRNWPGSLHFIGFPGASPEPDETQPKLDPTRPNILVSFGTHLKHLRPQLQQALTAWAAARPGYCFHLTEGGSEHLERDTGAWIKYRYLNYERHLGRFSAVVHHGGSGVLHHCMKAGVPALVWPQDFDQFDYAERLKRAGIALRCRKPEDIPPALDEVLGKPGFRERAREYSKILGSYDTHNIVKSLLIKRGLLMSA